MSKECHTPPSSPGSRLPDKSTTLPLLSQVSRLLVERKRVQTSTRPLSKCEGKKATENPYHLEVNMCDAISLARTAITILFISVTVHNSTSFHLAQSFPLEVRVTCHFSHRYLTYPPVVLLAAM